MADEELKNIEVKTYESDMAGIVGENQDGIVKKMIEEEEKKEKEVFESSPEQKRNTIFLSVSIILLILAFLAVFMIFLLRKDILVVDVKPQYTPLIFTDQASFEEVSDLKKEVIKQNIFTRVIETEVKEGGVEGFYLRNKERVLGLREFLGIIEAKLDQEKIEFMSDSFLLGVVNKEKNDFFILLKMRSIADVFGAMRAWEDEMFIDLSGFFGIDLSPDTKYLLEKSFEDDIVQNKNARVLRDNSGGIVMMYVFTDENSIVITNSEDAIIELISRLASARVKK